MPFDLSQSFQSKSDAIPKTIQLELSGGGAHGAYEAGVLEVLVPFWEKNGFKIDAVTGVSAGAVNAALLSYTLNSGQSDRLSAVMGNFWRKLGVVGDIHLKPLLDFHQAANFFSPLQFSMNKFPNIPPALMSGMTMMGKSSRPLEQLKSLLNSSIPPEGWNAIRSGPTETFIGSIKIDKATKERHPVLFNGQNISPETIAASAALRDFAPYNINGETYEDGGYDKIGFFLKDRQSDVLFAIGLKPLRDAHEVEDRRGVKTGQLHHDLARYYLDPDRRRHIDFICLDHPPYWNETSAMNNTSRNIDMLIEMGRADAQRWIKENGAGFGKQSSFKPSQAVLDLISPPVPQAA